jgi:cephalosporin hydroxylase
MTADDRVHVTRIGDGPHAAVWLHFDNLTAHHEIDARQARDLTFRLAETTGLIAYDPAALGETGA